MGNREIVIADDQPSVCKEVAALLKNEYTVHAFKSGQSALNYLEKNEADLILLDYYMPDMTGFETLLEIRMNKSLSKIPVIFLTAEINDRMEHEMLQRGAADYLRKPIDATELRKCVRKYLSDKA